MVAFLKKKFYFYYTEFFNKLKILREFNTLLIKYATLSPRIPINIIYWFLMSGVFGVLVIYLVFTNSFVFYVVLVSVMAKCCLLIGIMLKYFDDINFLDKNLQLFKPDECKILRKTFFYFACFRFLMLTFSFLYIVSCGIIRVVEFNIQHDIQLKEYKLVEDALIQENDKLRQLIKEATVNSETDIK